MLLSILIATIVLGIAARHARATSHGAPQPALIAHISKIVFGGRWRVAACIAHYESTDGAHLFNGVNLGPWQINVAAHPWVDRTRVVTDWLYSARVAYRISSLLDRRGRVIPGTGGSDWSAWSTHTLCGV